MEIFLSLFTSIMRSSAPLILWALAVVYAERVGIWFLGVEGIGLVGALAGVLGEIYFGHPLAGLACALLSGLLFGYIMHFLLIAFPTDQTAIGIAFNTTILGLTSFVYRLGGVRSASLINGYAKSYMGFNMYAVVAIILTIVSWWLLFRTGFGVKLRAVGESATAAEASGINVLKTRTLVMCLAGMLAAFGGDALTQGWVCAFAENVTAGRGFIGMAAVYLGRWNPLLAMVACFVFGIGESFSFRAQASAFSGTNTFYFQMLPYLLTLMAVAILGQAKSPADAGKPYIKN